MSTGPFTELNSRRMGPVHRFFVRRPRVMDALVVLIVGGPSAAAAFVPDQTRSVPLSIGLALVGAATLWWRRTHPLVVAGVVAALGVGSLPLTGTTSGLDVALGFALYAVAAAHAARVAWLTAAGTALPLAAAAWLWEEPTPDPTAHGNGDVVLSDDRAGTITGLVIAVLAAIAIGISVRNRRQHLADLMERANALARDRDRQAELARASERSRIAREMHDVVAHSLSVMITLADGASAALDRAPDRSRAALTELSSTGRTALGDMRRVLGALGEDGAPLEPTGEGQDLPTLVERFRTAGLPVHAEGLRLELPSDTGLRLALYRVVQESLTNVLRHAPGTPRVDVVLRHEPDRWEVEVTDHGGVVPARDAGGAGVGLVGMRERAAVLGGTVEAGPWEHGWRVHVIIPTSEADR